jgi:MFS transporter, BCD family, chlorophyll transporter
MNNSESSELSYAKQLGIFNMFRLGLFQMGLGAMSLLTLGVLNRVLIEGLKVPATIAVLAIAMHQFVAPARVLFGHLSDSKPIFGFHRTSYIWIGTAIFTTTSFIAVQVVWQLGASIANLKAGGGWVWTPETIGWVCLLGLAFAIYGLALSSSSTPFAALLVDVSAEKERSKLVGVVWSMLMVGIIIGAILSSGILKKVGAGSPIAELQTAINSLFVIVPAIVAGLAILATAGIEQKFSRFGRRLSTQQDDAIANNSSREDKITLGKAIRVLTASRQTGLFFTFLMVMTISLFMQEPILEPFGGEVFQMNYGQTTMLNAFWGTGVLFGLGLTGFLIIPRIGKLKTARIGCFLVSSSFSLIILSGFAKQVWLLQVALVIFGLASGVTTTGALNLMLDLTAAETAGTFLGAWGLAQAMARGLATVAGGVVLDIGRTLFQQPILAYGLVFFCQAMGMLLAVWFLGRIDVQEFQASAQQAISKVLASEID